MAEGVTRQGLHTTDIPATIFRAMGIPTDDQITTEKRPFYATKDGIGKAASEVFA